MIALNQVEGTMAFNEQERSIMRRMHG